MSDRSIFVNQLDGGSVDDAVFQQIRAGVAAALETGRADGSVVPSAEISVTLLDGPAMQELNARFHGVDAPTDVLSFDLGEAGGRMAPSRDDAGVASVLGDVYVCIDVAREYARDLDVPPDEELVRLAIHGTLHLLGHDHPDGDERYASEMYRVQETLVATAVQRP